MYNHTGLLIGNALTSFVNVDEHSRQEKAAAQEA